MKKIIPIIFIISSCTISSYLQNSDRKPTGIVFSPSKTLNMEMSAGLHARYMLIQLFTHPRLNLNSKDYRAYSNIKDDVQPKGDLTIKDTVSITLKSGISWNLMGKPPQAPKHFLFKLFTKNGIKEKAVVDRLKYLEFCYAWQEKDGMPYDMIEKFNRYYVILDENDRYLEMSYEIRFNKERNMKITDKKIKFYHND